MGTIDLIGDGIVANRLIDKTISEYVDEIIPSLRAYAFYKCSNLTTVNLPACTTIGYSAFTSCSSLTTASFPACTAIGVYAFNYCTNLSEIYIGTSNCSITTSTVFDGTSITSTTGAIYVPAEYVDAYKSRTNWQYFSNRIFGYNF